MTKEKKIEKIIEFFRQLINYNEISDEELNQLYFGFKVVLERNKELENDKENK